MVFSLRSFAVGCFCLLLTVTFFGYTRCFSIGNPFYCVYAQNVEQSGLELELDADEPLFVEPVSSSAVTGDDSIFSLQEEHAADLLDGLELLNLEQADKIEGLTSVIAPIEIDVLTLEGQLLLLEREARRLVLDGARLQRELALKRDSLSRLALQQKVKGLEITDVLGRLTEVVKLLYKVRRTYSNYDGKISLYGLLLQDGRASDLLLREKYLQVVQRQAVAFLAESVDKHAYGRQVEQQLEKEEADLLLLADRIALSGQIIDEQQVYKRELLADKQKARQFFSVRVDEAKAEQVKIQRELQRLLYELDDPEGVLPSESFIWPVSPILGISARFEDSSYYERFGLPHKAIDIPTDQLTPVLAIADALVLEVHDGGDRGYSYLVLAHADGFSSLYGHLYEVRVEEGETVEQGDVVALSGGTPGTRGAGLLTTGAHVHLEMLKEGEFVDPEEFLPSSPLAP